jgi:SlyX protein
MNELSEQRFVDIEMKLSHQEYLIEELNQVVREQTETITRLEMTLKKLSARVSETADARVGTGNEKPPHY